jgi:hypothetical protein
VVFTCRRRSVPSPITNKAVIYRLLFDVAAETLRTIAADPKHLGAQIGATLVLHTWGSAMTHHPHVHGIVPGGGLSAGRRTLGGLPAGFLPAGARALAAVPAALPGRTGEGCIAPASCSSSVSTRALADAGRSPLAGAAAHGANGWSMPSARLPVRRRCWPICRAIPTGWRSRTGAWSRWTSAGVTFRWKDYRAKGRTRHKTMTLLPTSSCAASCCTCCPAASTASATMAARQCRAPGESGQGSARYGYPSNLHRSLSANLALAEVRGFLLRGLFNVCPRASVHHPCVITFRADVQQTLTSAVLTGTPGATTGD